MSAYWYRGTQPEPRYRVREHVPPPIPDAPGHNTKPDPDRIHTTAEFMDQLRWLHDWAGNDSLRELSRRCGGLPSHATFSTMLRSETLPNFETLTVFIEALGLPDDVEPWRNAWRRLRMQGEQA